MIKQGWLKADDIRDLQVEKDFTKFFNVNSMSDIEILPHAARNTRTFTQLNQPN